MPDNAPVASIEPERLTLRLTPEEVEIVGYALNVEWKTQAESVEREVEGSFEAPDRREMYLTDAAWKVRRQAVVVDLLEKLGWVKD